ncbi:MAG: protein-glutamate O-methyltransferase CheR [bacterium]|nr:protein-glutamate O-methyltransferase CheR [bacterium]
MKNENEILAKISNLLLDRTGIFIRENHLPALKNKLNRILRDWKLSDYEELYNILVHDDYSEKFFDVVNEISVNVTDFYRQFEHFLFVRDNFVPEYLKINGQPWKIKAWSAACSTGEEAYSILMSLLDGFHRMNVNKYAVKLVASDISTRALGTARQGVYDLERVKEKLLEEEGLTRYFQKGFGKNEGMVKVKDFLQKPIDFIRLNLNEEIPFSREFDIVFIRNVLIYFSKEKQGEILSRICQTMKTGSYLFLGYSETARDLSLPLEYVQPSVYRKI